MVKQKILITRTIRFIKVTVWTMNFLYKAHGILFIVKIIRDIYDDIRILLYSFFLGLIINDLFLIYQNGITDNIQQSITHNAIYLIISIIIDALLHYDDWLLVSFMDEQIDVEFQNTLYKKINSLDWMKLEDAKTEKLLRKALENSTWFFREFSKGIISLISVIISFIFAFYTVKINAILLILLLLSALPRGLKLLYYTSIESDLSEKHMPIWVKIYEIRGFFQTFTMLFENKITNMDYKLRKIDNKERSFLKNNTMKAYIKYWWINIIILMTEIGIQGYILWYFIQQVISKLITVGSFQYYLTAFNKLKTDISGVFGSVGEINSAYINLEYIYQIMNMEPILVDGQKKLNTTSQVKIEFRNVWFKYPKTKKWALRNINVVVHKGEEIALVGENGAGKSTFLKLLLRAYDVTKGEILINDINIKKLIKRSWYKKVSIITQDFARYGILSVAQNITAQKITSKQEKVALEEAGKMAEAHEFISKLPNQYQTILTKKLEGGVELSSGQWQRIALARLFHSNKQLVILDEPTSSIDPVAENRIFKNIYEKLKNKTVILVSHRYNTVKSADRIFVFKESEIIERGSHNELLKQKGYYFKANEMQIEK